MTYLHTHRGPGVVIEMIGLALKKFEAAGLDLCLCAVKFSPPVKMLPSGKPATLQMTIMEENQTL